MLVLKSNINGLGSIFSLHNSNFLEIVIIKLFRETEKLAKIFTVIVNYDIETNIEI